MSTTTPTSGGDAKPTKHVPKHAPAQRSGKKKSKKGFFRRFWWVFVLVPILLVSSVAGALVYAYSKLTLAKPLPPIQTSYLYARDGTLLTSLHGEVDRQIIPFTQMPDSLKNAVIAVEDHSFYSHPGVDVVGVIRAAYTDLVKRQTVQGASTITEQLVKNLYAGTIEKQADGSSVYVVPDRTIKEKIREALLAVKLENVLGKDQILAKYLNTIYFGHGAYGAEAAAQTYWHEDASKLTLAQSATLAGLISSPTLFDPIDHPADSKSRRNYALDQMAHYGFIPQTKANQAKAKPCCDIPDIAKRGSTFGTPGQSEYFVDYAKRYLIQKYGSATVFGGGLKVTTTIDMSMQKAAEDTISKYLPSSTDPSAALVSIDPQTGEILAMVGGKNWQKSQLNLALSGAKGFGGSGRQAGSAFKIFTLATAMKEHYNLNAYWEGPSSISIDDPTCNNKDGTPWNPSNSSDEESGRFSLKAATAYSVNTVFAQLVSQIGPDKVVETANDMGIQSKLGAFCSVTLGSVGVNPLEMTNAYATLAAEGVRHYATPLLQVKAHGGHVVGSVASRGKQVIPANAANLVTYALEGVLTYGTASDNGLTGRPAAGKTGTAQNYVDAWFCGYTPQLATCVWMGYPESDSRPMNYVEGVGPVFGGTIPAAIWQDYMNQVLNGMPVLPFTQPTFAGYTVGPTTPVASPTPPPSPTPSPKPTHSPSPKPSPTPSPKPSHSPSP
ncbi:MAG: penicillin-binding protein [Actinomycetota bacterium]|nr:penicillin-binding protein [Actinomycetota bacterium]